MSSGAIAAVQKSPKVYITTHIVALATGILGVVIGAMYLDNAPCDSATIVPLPVWLLVYGCITICTSGVMVVVMKKTDGSKKKRVQSGNCLVGLFGIAWNIIGAVILFRDAYACQSDAYSLWAATLAILVINWIHLALLFVLILLGCVMACVVAGSE